MVETSLAFAALLTYAVAAVYAFVGVRLARQRGRGTASDRAMLFFGLWWIATSLNQVLGSTLYLGAAFGWSDVAVQLSYLYLQRLLLATSLVCLMYYLVYLQSGRDLLVPLIALYSVYFVSQAYALSLREAVGVQSYGWRTEVVFSGAEPAWQPLTNLFIVVPPVVGALLLFRVFGRVEGRTRRFRIAMIGGGFVAWWVLAVASGFPAFWDVAWMQALNRLVGITVALGILVAYEPTAWAQRRYGLEPFALA